jgi:hypothetical protein
VQKEDLQYGRSGREDNAEQKAKIMDEEGRSIIRRRQGISRRKG